MAYYTTSNGQVLVPSAQHVNTGVHLNPSINVYPQPCTVFNDRPLPLPGKYAVAFNKTSSIVLGVLLVLSGAAAMAGSAIGFRFYAALSEVGTGLWCGAMFVAAGSVAIAAGYHLSDSLIRATTATSGFAVAFAVTLIIISSFGLSDDVTFYSCYEVCGSSNDYCACKYDDWETFAIVANSIMIGAGAAAFIVSFWLFVICCVALCRTPSTRVVPIHVQCVPSLPTEPYTSATVIPNQQVHSLPVQYVQLSTAQNQSSTARNQAPDHRHSGRPESHRSSDD